MRLIRRLKVNLKIDAREIWMQSVDGTHMACDPM
jgi:hypothetical protein